MRRTIIGAAAICAALWSGAAARAENAAADLLARAQAANTAEAYQAVIETFPNTPEAREAQRLFSAIRRPHPAFARVFEARLLAAASRGARECDRCPVMVRVSGGSLRIGSEAGSDDEKPVRSVTVRSFAIGKYEVTFEQWDACVADGYCRAVPTQASGGLSTDEGWGRGRNPVMHVSWNDIAGAEDQKKGFLRWLNKRATGDEESGLYRLPSEAEWEYAARAGSQTRFSFGDNDDQLGAYAWHSTNSDRRTQPVGVKRPNRWGIHDMHGNVWEWGAECWRMAGEGARTRGDGRRSTDCPFGVLRGGSWFDDAWSLRLANRFRMQRTIRLNIIGFRVARTLVAE